MFLVLYFVLGIVVRLRVVDAQVFLPVTRSDADFLLDFANSTSHSCKRDIALLVESLSNHTLWAYRMWDATAKYPTGLTEGSVYQLGNFDECLSIDQPFSAQYCLTTVHYTIVLNTTIEDPFSLDYDPYESVYNKLYHTGDPNKVHRDQVHWGLCVPASCNSHEVQRAVQAYLDKQINADINNYRVSLEQTDCQVKPVTDAAYSLVNSSFCKIIMICMILVTICTVIDVRYCKDIATNGRITELLLCFSAKRNYKVLTEPDLLPALHGVSFLFFCITVLVHHLLIKLAGPIGNYENLEQRNRSPGAMILARADLMNEFYFFLSGVLIAFQMIFRRRNANPVRAIIQRYFRIMPVFAQVTLFYTTVISSMGSGPLWTKIIGTQTKRCQKNWWLNLLFLNNYIGLSNLCVLNGWFLAVDFQFFLLSIPLTMVMNKMSNRRRIQLFVAILFLSVLIPFAIALHENIEPVPYLFHDVHETILKCDYCVKLYFPSHTRTTTYILGMAFGFVHCKMMDSKIKLSVFKSILLFITSLAAMLACTIGSVRYYNPYRTYSSLEAASFIAFTRLAYPLGIGLFTLVIGYGTLFPWIPRLLSWSPFVPLSKLAFSANVVHIALQLINTASVRSPPTLTIRTLVNDVLAEIVVAQMISFVLFMCVENPINRLTRQVLHGGTRKKQD